MKTLLSILILITSIFFTLNLITTCIEAYYLKMSSKVKGIMANQLIVAICWTAWLYYTFKILQ